MRIRLATYVTILLSCFVSPLNAGQTIVIGPASYPITTMPLSDFNALPLQQQREWLSEREDVIERFSKLLESLNASDAEAMIAKIKRDRCCSMGFNSVGGAIVLGSSLGSILLSPLVLPTWVAYVTGGAAALGGFLLYRAGIFKENAITGQKDAENARSELIRDYYEKKLAYQDNIANEQEVRYWRNRALGVTEPIVLLPPRPNLRAFAVLSDDMEEVEVARQAPPLVSSDVELGRLETGQLPATRQGKNPETVQPPMQPPAGYAWSYKCLVKKKKSQGAGPKVAPPASEKGKEEDQNGAKPNDGFEVVVEK